jgi:superfamily II DNA or RNA helicase
LIASHVLNEGVDVPAASIAIILSGTGSQREFIQRMGRVLRKSQDKNKRAILYEVVAENTSEEGTSQRRRGEQRNEPQRHASEAGQSPKRRGTKETKGKQLEILPSPPTIYGKNSNVTKKAAESSEKWQEDDKD